MTPSGRSRMGRNVATAVDDWIPQTRPETPADPTERRDPVGTSARPLKVRATFQLPQELLDRARDAVVALASTEQLTLAELVEQAISNELERLQREHNHGAAFRIGVAHFGLVGPLVP